MIKTYLGVDVGSVSTNIVALDQQLNVLETVYVRTMGHPVKATQQGLRNLLSRLPRDSGGRSYRQRSQSGGGHAGG